MKRAACAIRKFRFLRASAVQKFGFHFWQSLATGVEFRQFWQFRSASSVVGFCLLIRAHPRRSAVNSGSSPRLRVSAVQKFGFHFWQFRSVSSVLISDLLIRAHPRRSAVNSGSSPRLRVSAVQRFGFHFWQFRSASSVLISGRFLSSRSALIRVDPR